MYRTPLVAASASKKLSMKRFQEVLYAQVLVFATKYSFSFLVTREVFK